MVQPSATLETHKTSCMSCDWFRFLVQILTKLQSSPYYVWFLNKVLAKFHLTCSIMVMSLFLMIVVYRNFKKGWILINNFDLYTNGPRTSTKYSKYTWRIQSPVQVRINCSKLMIWSELNTEVFVASIKSWILRSWQTCSLLLTWIKWIHYIKYRMLRKKNDTRQIIYAKLLNWNR